MATKLWYNTSYHTASRLTPFQVVYGREPLALLRFERGSTLVSTVEQQLIERDQILEELKTQLLRAQEVMKKGEDMKRRDVKLEVGDLVYLKLRPYHKKTLASRSNEKLSPRFYGPFAIEQEVGPVAYKLSLSSHCNIHPRLPHVAAT